MNRAELHYQSVAELHYQSVAGSRRRMSGVLWNTTTGRENGLTPGKCCTWRMVREERGERDVRRK